MSRKTNTLILFNDRLKKIILAELDKYFIICKAVKLNPWLFVTGFLCTQSKII